MKQTESLFTGYHCRAQYSALWFKWLVNPQNLLKRLKKSTAHVRNEKRCNDVSMQSGTLLAKKSWTKNEHQVSTVHSPLFFCKIAEIARFAERTAILVSNVLSLASVRVLNLLKGRGMVWEKAKKKSAPSHHTITAINPDALPLGTYEPKIVARIGKHSTLTILRKSRELWTV